jgi:hypothetical protein
MITRLQKINPPLAHEIDNAMLLRQPPSAIYLSGSGLPIPSNGFQDGVNLRKINLWEWLEKPSPRRLRNGW